MGATPTSTIGVNIAFKVFELAPHAATTAIDTLTKLETEMREAANVTANAYALMSTGGVTALATAKAAAELELVPPVGFLPLSGLVISGNTATLTVSRATYGSNAAFLVPFAFGAGDYGITPTWITAGGSSAATFASKTTGGIAINLQAMNAWGNITLNPMIIRLGSTPHVDYTLQVEFD
jgi:hypothetical protein